MEHLDVCDIILAIISYDIAQMKKSLQWNPQGKHSDKMPPLMDEIKWMVGERSYWTDIFQSKRPIFCFGNYGRYPDCDTCPHNKNEECYDFSGKVRNLAREEKTLATRLV